MEQILPLVKKYDAAVIALPNDVDEIPMEPDKRLDAGREDRATWRRRSTASPSRTSSSTRWRCRSAPTSTTGLATLETMRRIRDKLRAEHDLRLLQRLLRHARAARAQRHLPVDGDDRRA